MQAWDHLEAATKIQEKHPDRDIDDIVRRLHRAAELYGQLAAVSDRVGGDAAALLVARKERDKQQRDMMCNLMETTTFNPAEENK